MEIGKIIPGMGGGKPDVLVLGEVLVELTAPVPLREADTLRLSCSGDALNAAAAAAAGWRLGGAGQRVGDDELGDRILEFAGARGIDTTYVRRGAEPNGVYFAGAGGEFVYARRGSAGSTLGPDDVARAPLREAGAVVVSGITQALSESCAAAVDAAVSAAGGARGLRPELPRAADDGRRGEGRARARRAAHRARHAVLPGRHPRAPRHRRSGHCGGAAARARRRARWPSRWATAASTSTPATSRSRSRPRRRRGRGRHRGRRRPGRHRRRPPGARRRPPRPRSDTPPPRRRARSPARAAPAGYAAGACCSRSSCCARRTRPSSPSSRPHQPRVRERRGGAVARRPRPHRRARDRRGDPRRPHAGGARRRPHRRLRPNPIARREHVGGRPHQRRPGAWGAGIGRALVTTAETVRPHPRPHHDATRAPRPANGHPPDKERLHDWYSRRGYAVVRTVPIEHYVPQVAPLLTAPGDVLVFAKPL